MFLLWKTSQVLFSDLEDEGWLGHKSRTFIYSHRTFCKGINYPWPSYQGCLLTSNMTAYCLWPADSCRGYSRGRKQNFLTQSFTGTSKLHYKNCPSSLLTCSFTHVQDKKKDKILLNLLSISVNSYIGEESSKESDPSFAEGLNYWQHKHTLGTLLWRPSWPYWCGYSLFPRSSDSHPGCCHHRISPNFQSLYSEQPRRQIKKLLQSWILTLCQLCCE